MSIVSAPFLFLFLPAVVLVYYLIPSKNDLQYRNMFLVFASLFFYTWGEPIFIFVLLGMIFLTWHFGRMAFHKKNTRVAKMAIYLTIFSNIAVMLLCVRLEFILNFLSELFKKDFSCFAISFPIGFSFFIFSSISYVVDNYRGQCERSGSIWQTALYTSAFFKILQGPIISYHKFENQILDRQQSLDLIANGIWRISIGICKKVIISDNLSVMVNTIFSTDFSKLSSGDALLGCASYLVYMYFDFSGYSDMAIGLAELFGFSLPENFNYPYMSTSIAEFWNRWHMSLHAWFIEYLYYPILLGPSIRLRKFLTRHSLSDKTVQILQKTFVVITVWMISALWHSIRLGYVIWGFLNFVGILIEFHLKPIKNRRLNSGLHLFGLYLFLFLSIPLLCFDSFGESLMYYKLMLTDAFSLSSIGLIAIMNYGIYLLVGIIGCFPVLPYFKKFIFKKVDTKYYFLWDVCSSILLFACLLISISFILKGNAIDFLYQ